ncbi:carboxylesterase family protein [Henriciella sp. AS95]|uniref:carboxylesterase/lipase family protein n=1 Tax=Henriciella sp. AS95 TaxID=3135782 RepID=UPI0031798938
MTRTFAPSRRLFLLSAASATGATGLALPAWGRRALWPVVETSNGKLMGAKSGGMNSFKGIRYGAPTGGSNRFMPPQPVEKWSGVKEALAFSDAAPQMPNNRAFDYGDLIVFDRHPSGLGEDCLALNLWTPTLDKDAKKPVIVVLHGGGFYGGSGNSFGMDGDRMARFADSVVIAVNHRLGAFGFANLAELGGDDFAQSGAVGMLDIVAALDWIQENVAQFGGDPSRVMVYGQSGGGAKVSTLLAMPSAKGKMHAAGVMSGSMLTAGDPDAATKTAERLMAALDLEPGEIGKMQALPFTTILEAQAKLEAADRAKGEAPRSFGPVVDGTAIPRDPFSPDAPAVSKDVPMIISTALDERTYRMADFDLDEAGLLAYAEKRAGDEAEAAVALYKAEDPDASPHMLKARMDTDLSFRKSAFRQAELKAAQAADGGAPVWTYLWTWPSPAYGGRYGAVHGIDVGLSLNSVRGGLTGASAESQLMADRISSAWASFAATGDPNNERLPDWPAYTQDERATMIFDVDTRVENDPRADIRAFWQSL